VPLLDRSRKPHQLSPQGEELARLARNFFAGLEDYLSDQRAGANRLVIGAGERLIQWLLMPNMLPLLRAKFPQTSVLFSTAKPRTSSEASRKGLSISDWCAGAPCLALDWNRQGAGGRLITSSFLVRCVRSCLFRPKYPHLGRYPLAVLEGSGETRAAVVRLFERAGIQANIQLECSSLTQVAQAVEMDYAAFLPHLAKSRFGSNVDVHRIPGLEELDAEQTLVWNPERESYRPLIRHVVRILASA